MKDIFLVIIAIIPAVVLLWYFNKQDKGKKEPKKLMWKIFMWGIIAALFAVVIELNIEDFYIYLGITDESNFWLHTFLTAFVTAALVEEALKYWVVKKKAFNHPAFDEVMDGITYAIIASLGFATFENIFYVLDGGYTIGIVRALISVPAHALFSGIMGYYIGTAKFGKQTLLKGFLFAVFYHGLYDFLLFSQTVLFLLVLPLMAVMGVHLKNLIKNAQYKDHVSNHKPKKLTVGRILKIIFGTLFVFVGSGSIVGTLVMMNDPTSGFAQSDLIAAVVFALAMYTISYFMLRTSRGKTT